MEERADNSLQVEGSNAVGIILDVTFDILFGNVMAGCLWNLDQSRYRGREARMHIDGRSGPSTALESGFCPDVCR